MTIDDRFIIAAVCFILLIINIISYFELKALIHKHSRALFELIKSRDEILKDHKKHIEALGEIEDEG
jgi:hypothetical protein